VTAVRVEKGIAYRPWTGRLAGRTFRFWPIAEQGLRLVLRKKIFWAFLALSLLNFTLHSAMIYGAAQVKDRGGPFAFLANMSKEFKFLGAGEAYRNFIEFQGAMVMVMLALAGWFLLGADLRAGALPFYLSKPIGRLDYFLGKVVAASGLSALVSLVPALLLFLEYGAFTESLDYYFENLRVLAAILVHGTLASLVPAIVLLGLWALLRRMVPMILAWGSLFMLLPMMAAAIRGIHRHRWEATHRGMPPGSPWPDPWGWGLLDLWKDVGWVANALFGIRQETYEDRWLWAAAVIAGACIAACVAFWRRISAAEVVR
jgi:ABC-2 type transport system permease protein